MQFPLEIGMLAQKIGLRLLSHRCKGMSERASVLEPHTVTSSATATHSLRVVAESGYDDRASSVASDRWPKIDPIARWQSIVASHNVTPASLHRPTALPLCGAVILTTFRERDVPGTECEQLVQSGCAKWLEYTQTHRISTE
ncbi:hypothetical protein BDK88_3671 [Natrinema hispanicum]|uniref:Uncharacterized protein n=1 Tax=Natrinema hispanicum TaxID=392421 RepID=A0A482Y9T5_9EURY|nr:hypothetical protein BDK88_3671 [Natrinema hispanicum]